MAALVLPVCRVLMTCCGDLGKRRGGSTGELHLLWCSSSTESRFPRWKPNVSPSLVVPGNGLAYIRHCFVKLDFLLSENLRSSIGQRQCWCIVFFLKASFFKNRFLQFCCCEFFITATGALFYIPLFLFIFLGCVHPCLISLDIWLV